MAPPPSGFGAGGRMRRGVPGVRAWRAPGPESGLGLGPLFRSLWRRGCRGDQLRVVRLQVGQNARKTAHLGLNRPLTRLPEDLVFGKGLAEMGYLEIAILHLPQLAIGQRLRFGGCDWFFLHSWVGLPWEGGQRLRPLAGSSTSTASRMVGPLLREMMGPWLRARRLASIAAGLKYRNSP